MHHYVRCHSLPFSEDACWGSALGPAVPAPEESLRLHMPVWGPDYSTADRATTVR